MGSPPQELEFHGPVGPGNCSDLYITVCAREEENILAGGAWRGLEECWGFGVNFYQKAFIRDYLFSITCVLWRGRLADVPLFSRVEREEMTWMKVKVFSFYIFSCLGFIIYYVSA